MKFFSVATAFLAATCVSSQPVKRDASSIVTAIKEIGEQLTTVNGTINEFESGLKGTITALKIHFQSKKVGRLTEDATEITNESEKLNDADSQEVAVSVVDLQPKIFSVLDGIVAKKPQFDKAILGIGSGAFIVRGDLEKLQETTGDFGATLITKLSDKVAGLAPVIIDAIDARFKETLEVYAKKE